MPRRRSTLARGCAVAALAAVALAAAAAARAEPMGLEEAIGSTLGNAKNTQHEDNAARRAAGAVRVAAGAFDWNAAAQVGWQRLYVLQSQNGFLLDSLKSVDVAHFTAGVGREFRNGIEIRPGISTYYGGASSSAQAFAQTKTVPTFGIKIPLLRGLGEEAADADEIAAQEALKSAQLDRAFAAERAVHDAVQAYWRCAAAFDHVAVLDASLHDAEAYVALLRQLVSNGATEPTGLQRNEADLVTRRVNRARADDAIHSCQRDLTTLTGKPPGQSGPVPTTQLPLRDGIVPPELALDEAAAIEIARTNRKDLAALRRTSAAEAARLRGARDGDNPALDILVDPTLVGVRFTRSLQQNIEKGRIEEAAAAESEARVNLEQLDTKMQADIGDAMRSLREARSTFVAMSAAAPILERAVAGAQRQAQASEGERQQYREAQDQLAQLRHQLIDASLEYAANLAALRLAMGTLDVGDLAPAAAGPRLAPLFVMPPFR
jgi:outer membrane protein TolC